MEIYYILYILLYIYFFIVVCSEGAFLSNTFAEDLVAFVLLSTSSNNIDASLPRSTQTNCEGAVTVGDGVLKIANGKRANVVSLL